MIPPLIRCLRLFWYKPYNCIVEQYLTVYPDCDDSYKLINDKIEGTYIFDSFWRILKAQYFNGYRHGRCVTFYKSKWDIDITRTQQMFKNGKAYGKIIDWHKNMKFREHSFDDEGNLHGVYRQYYIGTSILHFEHNYDHGKLHGKGTLWHADGRIKKSTTYCHGQILMIHILNKKKQKKVKQLSM